MRVLQSWLKQYIPFGLPPVELADRLTMLGLEFESIEHLGDRYKGFVVGKVIECAKHPNADKLTVCKVDVGKETLQIVCGATNVAVGQKVPVGLVGATVPKNQHDPNGAPFVLSQVKLRGVESSGMICSSYELDLGKDADGILVLAPEAITGQSLAEYLGMHDVAYDVEITPNRPDWLSHIGIAREIGVLLGKRPKLPAIRLKESTVPIRRHLSVAVEDSVNCPRFAARMIRDVHIGPSPEWLQRSLRNAGLRPRNNVVDITNFVMLECGQPLHAFDYALLHGNRIIVRQARPGLTFRTLDGKEHNLQEGTVMVCDGEREVSIAGVMGGANSEISDATVDVVLESAYWNPSSIRRTAKSLGIISDASQRFERGADPNGVLYALDRAAQLVTEVAGGELLKGAIDVYPRKIRERVISLRPGRVNAVLGTSLTNDKIVRYLRLLDMTPVPSKGEGLKIRVPTYRIDVEREIDLIEEVARVHGYDNIEEKTTATVDFVHPFPKSQVADAVRDHCIGGGYQEVISNSMQDTLRSAMSGAEAVRILNPQNQDMATLRTSLVPGLLEVVARNVNFRNLDLRLFEIGHVFSIDHSDKKKFVGDFLEDERICLLLTGLAGPRHWSESPRPVDFFDLKGEVEDLLRKFALDKCRFISYSTSNGLTDNTLAIEIHGSYAGFIGCVTKDVGESFGLEQDVFIAELLLPALEEPEKSKYVPLPKFPGVRRDVAFIVDAATPAEDLVRAIREGSNELLRGVEVFDVYQGDKLPAGKKSIAFSLELRSEQRTLTDAEIDVAVRTIVRKVEDSVGATLRSMK